MVAKSTINSIDNSDGKYIVDLIKRQ